MQASNSGAGMQKALVFITSKLAGGCVLQALFKNDFIKGPRRVAGKIILQKCVKKNK